MSASSDRVRSAIPKIILIGVFATGLFYTAWFVAARLGIGGVYGLGAALIVTYALLAVLTQLGWLPDPRDTLDGDDEE